MGKIIVLVSACGGQGRSTVAVGLARKLSKLTVGSVALIDGCTDGRATGLLGEAPTVSYDVGDVMSKQCDVPDASYWSDDGFLVMANPSDDSSMSVTAVRNLFSNAKHLFDYTIFDCPAGSFARISAIAASANITLICTEADSFHLRAALRLRRLLPEQDSQCRLVLTRFSVSDFKRGLLENIDDSIDIVKARLIGIVPYDGSVAALAEDEHLPYEGKVMTAVGNIALRLLGRDVPLMKL